MLDGHLFYENKSRGTRNGLRIYWECVRRRWGCHSRVMTGEDKTVILSRTGKHNHGVKPDPFRVEIVTEQDEGPSGDEI